MRQVFHKHRNIKKCYCYGLETHMLNNFEIRDTIARYQQFDRIYIVHSHHQQTEQKGYEQTAWSDSDVSVSSKKISGWNGLQIILHGRKNDKWLVRFDRNDYDG